MRWVFLSLIGVIGLLAAAILILYIIALLRLNQTYEIQEEHIIVPVDTLAIERGKHLVEAVTAWANYRPSRLITPPAIQLQIWRF